ncbi:MAG: PemK-like protein [Lacunisphaera sp.]|nr:PemK-like protein [Lacunisphaera sp.]
MKLRRWDVVFVRVEANDATGHPGIVLSHEGILDDPKQERINVLVGTKKQPAQGVGAHHVVLNGADGLEFLTLVDCSLIFVARKSAILRSAGIVTFNRRQEIQRKVRAYLGLG